MRGEIYNSIMLSGGTTLFPGFPTRLKSDIYGTLNEDVKAGKRAEKAIKIKIIVYCDIGSSTQKECSILWSIISSS